MDLEQIKRKLRALQSMAERSESNEAEALNAANLMAALLTEHGLTAAEITATNKTDAATPGAEEWGEAGRLHDVVRCAPAVAAFFDCKVWSKSAGGKKSVVMFGFPQDTAAATAMLGLIRQTMESEWAAYWRRAKATSHTSGQVARTSFLAAMASRISARLTAMKQEQRDAERQQAQAAGSTALVVVKDRAVGAAFTQLNLRLRTGSGRSRGRDSSARVAGDAAGQRANLTGHRARITG
jgi:hypothetical protein